MEDWTTHSALVQTARRWLLKRHSVVITELACSNEEPDAIGWRGGISTLIEVKATRSDFLADKSKPHRRHPAHGIGHYRYYFTPKGLIALTELPESWGLLEYDGKRVYKTRGAELFGEVNHIQEKVLLISTLRRIGQSKPEGVSIRAYYYQTQNRATLSLDLEVVEEV